MDGMSEEEGKKKNRLRGDVITDSGLGGDVIWRMATSCSPSPVRIEQEKNRQKLQQMDLD